MSDNDLKYGISWVPSNANDTTGGQSENYSMNCDKDLIMHEDAEAARDELVRVLNCINSSGTLDYADYCELFTTIEREFDALKSVPHEMSAVEYLKIEQRCKSWCTSKCRSNGGCESCCYHEFCWADAIEPEEYVGFYTLWAREHPEEAKDE